MVRKHDPDAVHLRLRLTGQLRRRLEQAATRNSNSLNAEIIDRLERSFAKDDVNKVIEKTVETTLQTRRARVEELQKRLTRGTYESKQSAALELAWLRLDIHSERIERTENDVLVLIAALEQRGFIRRSPAADESSAPAERKPAKEEGS